MVNNNGLFILIYWIYLDIIGIDRIEIILICGILSIGNVGHMNGIMDDNGILIFYYPLVIG